MNRHANREFTFVDLKDSKETNAKKIRVQATRHSHRDPNRKRRGHNKPRGGHSLHNLAARKPGHDSVHEGQPPSLPSHGSEQDPNETYPAQDGAQLMKHMDGGRGDPFETFPVNPEPWFNWLLDYYRTVHLPPGIEVVQRSMQEGELYIDWHMREAMTEPCFFYMQLLNAATPIVVHGGISPNVVFWIRSKVVSSLNEAIADPTRQLTVPTLLTVASIALHERLYGDNVQAIEVHGKAFTRMVTMVGGIEALRVPRICFALLKFTDDVLSASNAQESTADLLARWAPDELREKHPGYESDSS